MTVITRFAPSPTGYMHVGNVRMALMNALLARQQGGKFILRLDDTDQTRVKPEYVEGIHEDLAWLGLLPDQTISQTTRRGAYTAAIEKLKTAGRLYPCFETAEELQLKRKTQLARGLPPLYDRVALELTPEQIQEKLAAGQVPHWRFKLLPGAYHWQDLCRGESGAEAQHISDPVLLRENGDPVYTLTSVVDDMDEKVTHIIRGEDHVSNTIVQLQIFEALGADVTKLTFGHYPLITDHQGKPFSKRSGDFSIRGYREAHFLPQALLSYLMSLGAGKAPLVYGDMEELVAAFDPKAYGRGTPSFDEEAFKEVNRHFLNQMSYVQAQDLCGAAANFDEKFWMLVRGNITTFEDIAAWQEALENPENCRCMDADVTQAAIAFLKEKADVDAQTWDDLVAHLKETTGKKGKALFYPLRMALTGQEHGPQLKDIFLFLGLQETLRRLEMATQAKG